MTRGVSVPDILPTDPEPAISSNAADSSERSSSWSTGVCMKEKKKNIFCYLLGFKNLQTLSHLSTFHDSRIRHIPWGLSSIIHRNGRIGINVVPYTAGYKLHFTATSITQHSCWCYGSWLSHSFSIFFSTVLMNGHPKSFLKLLS